MNERRPCQYWFGRPVPKESDPKKDGFRTELGSKKDFGELLDDGRVVTLATENVEIGGIALVRKMAANERCLDKLDHRVAGHFSLTKMHDLAVAVSFHADQLAELEDIGFDVFRIPYNIRPAFLQIDRSRQSPRLSLTEPACYDNWRH